MKFLPALTLGFALVAFNLPLVAQKTLTFDPSKDPADYAQNLKTRSYISLTDENGSGLFSFRSEGGGELILLHQDGQPLAPGDFVDIELRCSGQLTMGVFLRGDHIGDPAYMAFFSASPNGTVRLSLTKTTIDQVQRPSENAFASGHTHHSEPGEWMIVRFEVDEIPDVGVTLRASILGKKSGNVILEIDGVDLSEPLQPGGALGLRFFANRTEEGSILDIRSITTGKSSSK